MLLSACEAAAAQRGRRRVSRRRRSAPDAVRSRRKGNYGVVRRLVPAAASLTAGLSRGMRGGGPPGPGPARRPDQPFALGLTTRDPAFCAGATTCSRHPRHRSVGRSPICSRGVGWDENRRAARSRGWRRFPAIRGGGSVVCASHDRSRGRGGPCLALARLQAPVGRRATATSGESRRPTAVAAPM